MSVINTGLSGLRAATVNLSVIGNNIANSGTIGFKQSRAEFSDVYASNISGIQIGNGVEIANVNQEFSQGGVNNTGRGLDLAISGEGFFIESNASAGGATSFSRAGNYHVDKNGYVVAPSGARLQGYQGSNGIITPTINDIRLDTAPLPANATGNVKIDQNLSANTSIPAGAFDANDPNTYNTLTSMEVYDSLGNAHALSSYFVKTSDNNWDVHVEVDGTMQGSGTVTYSDNGLFSSSAGLGAIAWTPSGGAAGPQSLNIDLSQSTQYGIPTMVRHLEQDGYTAGTLSGIDVDPDGIISGRYSNGQLSPISQVAIAKFRNQQGLLGAGNNAWFETRTSGQPLISQSNSTGAINAGALEDSNVDLTKQMVALIAAQRSFQVNAKSIQAADTLTQTILSLD